MKTPQRSYAVAGLLFGALINMVSAAAASNSGTIASVASLRPAEIQILEIDAPALSSRESADKQKQKERSQERAGQQEQARKRAQDAMAEAERKEGKAALDPAVKFNRRIDGVERLLREERFHLARGIFDQAMKEKPADLPVSDRVRTVEAQVNAQSTPVEVSLKSDGETYVSISTLMPPQKLFAAKVKLLPGDYEVKGARRHHTDVSIKLRIRNGEPPPPVISVVAK